MSLIYRLSLSRGTLKGAHILFPLHTSMSTAVQYPHKKSNRAAFVEVQRLQACSPCGGPCPCARSITPAAPPACAPPAPAPDGGAPAARALGFQVLDGVSPRRSVVSVLWLDACPFAWPSLRPANLVYDVPPLDVTNPAGWPKQRSIQWVRIEPSCEHNTSSRTCAVNNVEPRRTGGAGAAADSGGGSAGRGAAGVTDLPQRTYIMTTKNTLELVYKGYSLADYRAAATDSAY